MRRAFTLIELLVAVTVIGILAALTLGAVASSRTAAKRGATRMRIVRIDNAIRQQLQQFEVRRLPVEPPASVMPANNGGNLRPQVLWMLNAKRDLMRLEMPDRWSDVFPPPPLSPTDPVALVLTNMKPTSLMRVYRRLYDRAVAVHGQALVDENASAECLYMICANNRESGEFRDSDWGDVDGDGLREFQDNWGHPIAWIRWPAGFTIEHGGAIHDDVPATDDPFKLTEDYALYPLVYSAGPDGIADINHGSDGGLPMPYTLDSSGNLRTCTPDAEGHLVGEPLDIDGDGNMDHFDNIHNHSLGR